MNLLMDYMVGVRKRVKLELIVEFFDLSYWLNVICSYLLRWRDWGEKVQEEKVRILFGSFLLGFRYLLEF